MTDPASVRLGVLVDGSSIAGWQQHALRRIVDSGVGTIVAVIVNAAVAAAPSQPPRRDWGRSLWRVIDRAEGRLAARVADRREMPIGAHVDERVPIEVLGATTTFEVVPKVSASGFVHRFVDEDVDRIAALELDVLIRFGFGILRGRILEAAHHGIWSFHHGDNTVNRGSVPGFYEIVNGEEYTGTILQRLTDELDNGVVLRRARYVTVDSSWNHNRRQIYWKSSRLLVDALRELQRNGTVRPVELDRPLAMYSKPLYREPVLRDVVVACAKAASTRVRHATRYRTHVQVWRLLVMRGGPRGLSLWRAKELTAPEGRYWADPFVVRHAGMCHVFFEDFDLSRGRGRVSTGRLENNELVDVEPAVAPDYHVSYPFVFRIDGVLHMIPESCENRTIELWQCVSFPARWERVAVLMDEISAVDTTAILRDGTWWLFSNLDRDGLGDHADELHLFMSPDLTPGSLTPHPANPVVADAAMARMAGALFTTDDGTLIRPAQKGGQHYGGGLQLMRVDELSPEAYRETLVESVGPDWDRGVMGLHHYGNDGDATVMDAARWERRRH
jgi:hypothetical protein